ncbi:MAG TPA: type II CAAX prenyl endopeptidase Rce1 family protein [Xenococcaceae cyanobacterium]
MMATVESPALGSPTLVYGGWGAILILITVTLHAILALLPANLLPIAIVIASILFISALVMGDPIVVHVTLLNLAIAIGVIMFPWPLLYLIPLGIYGVIVVATPSLRQTLFWWHWGKFDFSVWQMVILTVAVSGTALLLWFLIFHPDLSYVLTFIPSWQPLLLILSGLSFALVNAAVEETIYRGVIMQGLDAVFGANYVSLLLQAVVFGTIHLNGVPGGNIGVLMASIYGLMLGIIKRFASGMLAPFIAHVFADLVIFSIVVILVKGI